MPLNIADLTITSPDVTQGARIADKFTAEHGNAVPRLVISGVPADAVELSIVMHDPDAPLPRGFTHWVLHGLPAVDGPVISTATARQAPNSAGIREYSGPQPPPEHGTHHYYFWVYALNTAVSGIPGHAEFLAAYADNIVEQNRLVGTYSR